MKKIINFLYVKNDKKNLKKILLKQKAGKNE